MQQSSKHDTAATNRGTIQDDVRYSVGREVIKGKLHTVQVQYSSRQFTIRSSTESRVQFTPAHDKESRVQRTEVKILLPGRALQNTEIEDTVFGLCVVGL
jgi:hypothetical protein